MNKVISSERLPIKLWLDDPEEGALEQAKKLVNLPFLYKWFAGMPDLQRGYGMPVGGIMATQGMIMPYCVGMDIGCGMGAIKLSLTEIEGFELLGIREMIMKAIPKGFHGHEEPQQWSGFDIAPDSEIIQARLDKSRYQLGTLGGGNHFIEIQQGDDGHIWVMVHSGSRNIGLRVAKWYHNKAKKLCERWESDIPHPDLSFLPMQEKLGREYYLAMNWCLKYAETNRAHMMEKIVDILNLRLGVEVLHEVNIHHNYAAFEHHYGKNVLIHRKGATKATEGLQGIIPGSMGTNSYIVEGLGNPESFMSCSHGAGRDISRTASKKTLDLVEEQDKMSGVIHGLTSHRDLDEAPGAYKDIQEVMQNQTDLVKVLVKLTPLASIKG